MPPAPSPDAPSPDVSVPAKPREPSWAARLAPVLDRWLAIAAAACWMVAPIRLLPFQTPLPFSAFEAEARWAAALALVGLGLAALRRSKKTAAAFGLALAILVPWSLEWIPVALGRDTSASTNLRVFSTNVLAPNPSAELAQEILHAEADVVLVQEASAEWWALLEAEGVLERYPHHVEEAHSFREDYMGIAILSRWPIESGSIVSLGGTGVPMARVDVTTPNGARVRLYSVHTWPPYAPRMLEMHVRQMEHLRELARADAEDPTLDAVIFGGDFNASPMSYQYRLLRDAGFVSAHERVGRGFATTWPNLPWPFPPMRLDHVFLVGEGAEVVSVAEGIGEGSDHQPVRVELSVSPRP